MTKSTKMPSSKELLKKKKMFWKKKEEVWVYLEREMRENIEHKPYNEKVGEWLRFLKDLKGHFREQDKKKYQKLTKEIGPPWFIEFSPKQRDLVKTLGDNIHQDYLASMPRRTRKTLKELGVFLKLSNETLMKAIKESKEEAGYFLWNLYKDIYKTPPSFLKHSYDHNAMIIMSSMVFLDLENCYNSLDKLLGPPKTRPQPERPKTPKYSEPKNEKMGVYLQKMYAPMYSNHPSAEELKNKNLTPVFDSKVKIRSTESYESLLKDTSFLEKRAQLHKGETEAPRRCSYKFWEPPAGLRCRDPKMKRYLVKLKMVKLKAKANYMKHKPQLDNIQFHIGTVAFIGAKPHYLLHNILRVPTEYIPLNNGIVITKTGETVTHIGGYWKYPREIRITCDETCDCMKWEPEVMKYLNETKCRCGHFYDYYHESDEKSEIKCTEKFFTPPANNLPMTFDFAKIYQMDPKEDFIKDKVQEALKCSETSVHKSTPKFEAVSLKDSELTQVSRYIKNIKIDLFIQTLNQVAQISTHSRKHTILQRAFLADLSEEPLMIPHLPQANLLHNLRAWVRKRVKGPISPKLHKKWMLKSERRWVEIDRMDFKARAYFIPFTPKQLKNFTWSHRGLVQNLFSDLLNDFTRRNQMKQVEHARLLWSTMKHDYYHKKGNDAFHNLYFTYFPSRLQDSFLINPYDPNYKHKGLGKTCPLPKILT